MSTKYIAISAICALIGATTEAKQKEVVSLLADPEFAEGRTPVSRNNDVFIEEKTVYEAAHHGPAGFPADDMYENFPKMEFGAVPAEEAADRPARTPRTPRTEAAEAADNAVANRIGAALGGIPEAAVEAPAGSVAEQPRRTPDAPAEDKPKATRRRRTTKEEPAAPPATTTAAATTSPEADAPTSAVDAAVERTKFAAARITRDEALAALTRQKETLEIELASVMYAIENI